MQEVALSQQCSLFWGDAEIEMVAFLTACLFCMALIGRIDIHRRSDLIDFGPVTALYFIYRQFQPFESAKKGWLYDRKSLRIMGEQVRFTLWIYILDITCVLHATDDRDHVYALLACPSAKASIDRHHLHADYTICEEELNFRVADAFLRDPVEGPWVLCAVKYQKREDLMRDLTPSWVVKWGYKNSIAHISSPTYWYRAGGLDKGFQAKREDRNTLVIRGFLFDKVVWMSDNIFSCRQSAAGNNDEPKAQVDILFNELDNEIRKSGKQLQPMAFLNSLVRDYPDDLNREDANQKLEILNTYLKSVGSKLFSGNKGHSFEPDEAVAIFRKALGYTFGYSTVVTSSGRIGLVQTTSTRIGDSLCIFHGVSVPFVLAETTEGRYKLASQAYIHGAMAGELVEQFEAQDIILE
jgi:hypothetical protein